MSAGPGVERVVGDVERALHSAPDEPIIVGIAGPPGSGKSTLAVAALSALRARGIASQPAPLDGWHHTEAELERRGLLDVKGAPETFDAAGYVRIIERIRDVRRSGDAVDVPSFEHGQPDPMPGTYRIDGTTRVVVTEGNYLLLPDAPWSKLRALFTLAYWVDADLGVLRERLLERQVSTGKSVERATSWVDRSDLRNAEIVKGRSVLDGVVRLG